jgi:hypothetical protein
VGESPGAAFANLAARVVPVDWVQVVAPVLEAHELPAREPGQDGRGVGGGVDRPEQEVHTDPRAPAPGRQRLHHRLCARIEQIVGLPDQHLQKHRRHRRRRMTRPKRPQAGGTQLLPLRRRQVAK